MGNKNKKNDGTKCSQTSLSVDDFEMQVDYWLSRMEVPDAFVKWAIKWLKKLHNNESLTKEMLMSQIRRLITQTEGKIHSLLDWYLDELSKVKDESDLSVQKKAEDKVRNQYEDKKTSLEADLGKYKDKRQQLESEGKGWLEMAENTLYFSTNARHWLAQGNSDQKRAIVRTLGSNFILTNGKVLIEQRIPFLVLAELKEKQQKLLNNIGTEEMVDESDQKTGLTSIHPIVMPRLDSNQNTQLQRLLSCL